MKKKVLLLILLLSAAVTFLASSTMLAENLPKLPEPTLKSPADPNQNPYNWFFNYRLNQLAETTDPLVQQTIGTAPEIDPNSWWTHPSYNSASVAFATTTSTLTRIEYGTTGYTRQTEISESYFFNHLHYLTDLQENTTYHYRVIYQDRAGLVKATPDKTLTTKTFTTETKLTNHDFPLQITQSGTYVLTEDVVSAGLGINVKSSNVTIDLNGHTLIYDNETPTATKSPDSGWQYIEDANYGIRAGLWNFVNLNIYNGRLKQGAAGTPAMSPIFLFHMSSATKNEIAGITADYYSDSTAGIRTNNGKTHHNVVYDKGTEISDRHAGLRALHAGADSTVAYNSLRRFRHRGIDCDGANCEVAHNELYSDSYATNSFAIGSGENHNIHDNKIFGMGYLFIGIGWGNGMRAESNLIYGRCYAPNQRSDEYVRPSSVAGMRVTDFDGNGFSRGMLVENNTIVLLAEKSPVSDIGCTMARGLWLSNGTKDAASSMIYRANTIKVEALAGNYNPNKSQTYYNGDVNNVLAPISMQGGAWVSEEIASAILFEDNHLIANVNHIVIGEGYGIGSGARFYRTTLEKIPHDNEFFHPIRLGFWYWNTLENKILDTTLIGITEEEFQPPQFFGGAGKMDISYGFTKKLLFTDQYGTPLSNQTLTLQSFATAENHQTLQITTDYEGYAAAEILTAKHYKYGNSQEENGVTGTPARLDYQNFTFTLAGYQPATLALADLKTTPQIILKNPNAKPNDNNNNDDDNNNNPNNGSSNNSSNNNNNLATTPNPNLPQELPHSGTTTPKILLTSLSLGLSAYLLTRLLRAPKL
jgi:hypothetical protein